MAVTVQANINGAAQAPMTSTEPLNKLEGTGSTHDVVDEVIAAALESEARTHWFSFTTKVSPNYFRDLFTMAAQIFKPLDTRKGMVLSISHQSYKSSFIDGTVGSPVYSAMRRSGEDLVCKCFFRSCGKRILGNQSFGQVCLSCSLGQTRQMIMR